MTEAVIGIPIGALFALLSLQLSIFRKRIDLFAPPMIILILMWLQYYLPALTLSYYDYWVYPHRWEKNYVILYPLLMSSIAWASFLVGYGLRGKLSLGRALPVPILSRYTIMIAKVMVVVGTTSLIIAVQMSGGIISVIQAGEVRQGTGIWMFLGNLTLPGILFLLLNRRHRKLALLASIVYFVVFMAAQGRGASFRGFILLLITTYYLNRYYFKNLRTLRFLFTLVIFLFFIIYTGRVAILMVGVSSLGELVYIASDVIKDFWLQAVMAINRSISRIEQLSIGLELVPNEVPYFFGIPMLSSLLGIFQKYLLPDYIDWRIILTSVSLYGSIMKLNWGMGGSGVLEWYVNFGVIGVIVGWLLLGLVARCIYEWFVINRENSKAVIPLYAKFILIFMGVAAESIGHMFSLLFLLPLLLSLRWKKHP